MSKLKCQIPYNYVYGEKIVKMIYDNKQWIDSIYFGFENACRDMGRCDKDVDYHINFLRKIKQETGIKLAYVLNTVLDEKLNNTDKIILNSGMVDIVIIAKDSLYREVYNWYGDSFDYEVSRFYYYIKENTGEIETNAKYYAFGFERELVDFWKKKNRNQLIYIVNENCYDKCEMKLVHNTNQLVRNKGEKIAKFNCPYIDKRRFYDYIDIDAVNDKYSIDILKICDRAFPDEKLENELEKWLEYIKIKALTE